MVYRRPPDEKGDFTDNWQALEARDCAGEIGSYVKWQSRGYWGDPEEVEGPLVSVREEGWSSYKGGSPGIVYITINTGVVGEEPAERRLYSGEKILVDRGELEYPEMYPRSVVRNISYNRRELEIAELMALYWYSYATGSVDEANVFLRFAESEEYWEEEYYKEQQG